MIGFVFCHGWSYDASAMQPLQTALAQHFPAATQVTVDLGFYADAMPPNSPALPALPILTPEIRWIAIGHSYGFAWLLQQPVAWHAAISLNGFTRFCRHPGQPTGMPVRLLDAMLARLQQDAPAVVQEFQTNCGMPRSAPQAYAQPVLLEHLHNLRELKLALPSYPILALASCDDAIVPITLARACFSQSTCTLQEYAGDHTRLLREPVVAANAIAEFMKEQYV